jgi:hypothetical protein
MGCRLPTVDAVKLCGTGQARERFCLTADPKTMKNDGAGSQASNEEYVDSVSRPGWDVEGICSEYKM